MNPTKKTETPFEKFERTTRNYTEMRYVTKVSGLEFHSEPLTREQVLYRMDRYGYHPAGRIPGMVRVEGRTAEGPWLTV